MSADISDDPDLREVRRIILSVLPPGKAQLFLFGSRVRGEASRTSDIDVAILPHQPLPFGTLARIREALEESCIPHCVDVVDLSEADAAFRNAVTREGVRWSD